MTTIHINVTTDKAINNKIDDEYLSEINDIIEAQKNLINSLVDDIYKIKKNIQKLSKDYHLQEVNGNKRL